MLVQLSFVSKHLKDKERENRGEDITACQVTNIISLRKQGQVVEDKRKAVKEEEEERNRNKY